MKKTINISALLVLIFTFVLNLTINSNGSISIGQSAYATGTNTGTGVKNKQEVIVLGQYPNGETYEYIDCISGSEVETCETSVVPPYTGTN